MNQEDAEELYKIKVLNQLPLNEKFDAIVVAVAHKSFVEISINDWNKLNNEKKADILAFYYKLKDNHEKIVHYFNDFEIYLSKTTLKSFTKSVINHKF